MENVAQMTSVYLDHHDCVPSLGKMWLSQESKYAYLLFILSVVIGESLGLSTCSFPRHQIQIMTSLALGKNNDSYNILIIYPGTVSGLVALNVLLYSIITTTWSSKHYSSHLIGRENKT